MKKLVKIPIVLCIIAIIFSFFIFKNQNNSSIKNPIVKIPLKKVKVPEEYEMVDKNKNDVFDPIDLVNAAREEAKNKTKYKSAYYVGGYPPKGEGVCTDVIWRAFNGAGIDLKQMVDKDIQDYLKDYPRVKNAPDPNIDFRRVPNLNVFFQRHALSLTKEVKPFNIDNLRQWQPGDIVVFLEPYEHIGIISNKRGKDGVPYIIHNSNPHASEVRNFNLWRAKVAGHYRWRFSDKAHSKK
ncbi:DUF1287 domain-containing protein [Clostridium sp. KNHs214]|uniref:DUF1287 domain-containing protein n=1 Tax=Clostridium sp. KNHs214 TaxID=1540257 RepID=UPI000558A888|nr:DUF1287 domain-containing protein [Clostridium sp. KNHs214]